MQNSSSHIRTWYHRGTNSDVKTLVHKLIRTHTKLLILLSMRYEILVEKYRI